MVTEGTQAVIEGSHTGEDNGAGMGQFFRLFNQTRLCSQKLESFPDTLQVA